MTAQVPEKLELEGEWVAMTFEPPLPRRHPLIWQRPEGPRRISTACWRRYVGRWALREGQFLLVGFEPDSAFELLSPEPLFADWFSGVLRIPRGEMLMYVHMGFGSVYAQELHIKIKDGVEVARRVRDNRERQLDKEHLTDRAMPGVHNGFEGDDF